MPRVSHYPWQRVGYAHGENIKETLDSFDIDYDFHVSYAHRKPKQTASPGENAMREGVKSLLPPRAWRRTCPV
jgi:phosphoribosylcarboxyaminoimidazole (NCAIR) mutase